MKNPLNWEPVDYIVGFIAITICFCLAVGVVGRALIGQDNNWDKERSDIVVSLVSTMFGAVTMYIGAKIQQGRDKQERERDSEQRTELASLVKENVNDKKD